MKTVDEEDDMICIWAMYWYFGIHNKFQNKTFIYWIHLQKRLLNELLGNDFIGFSQIMNSDEWIIHESFYFVLDPRNGVRWNQNKVSNYRLIPFRHSQ